MVFPPIAMQILKKMFNSWLIGQFGYKTTSKILCNLLYINRCITQALLSCKRLLALLCQMPARGKNRNYVLGPGKNTLPLKLY